MIAMSLAHFIAHVEQMEVEVHIQTRHALEHAAQIVQAEARREIGHYQGAAGPFAAWQELADSTKEDRVRRGFPENEPLLRTGEMRDSIQHHVTMRGVASGEAEIGSNNPKAVWQELGTRRIPPRSFLGGALHRMGPHVANLCGHHFVTAIYRQHQMPTTFTVPR